MEVNSRVYTCNSLRINLRESFIEEEALCTFPPPPTSRKGETQGSPPFAAAVPAVGAGLAPLWGGHILLPVLGGRRRASPFADLGGEEDTQTCSRTAPESVLS